MSNFCRITGRTRGVPTRSHYAPLLPPISKADARRLATCHVTRGALAMPYPHHFIPVILVQRKRRATLAHAGLRRDVPPHQSSLKAGLVQQAPAEVWPPPDWDKRRAAREAALQKLDEARGGRAAAAAAKETRRREERPSDWDEDVMLGRKIPEEGSEDKAAIPVFPDEDSRNKSGGVPNEEDISMPQAATAEEIGQAAPPPEDEPMHITHKVLSEYRYVIPVLEGDEAKPLRKIIESEGEKAKAMEATEGGPNSRYVYIVDQYQCGIVLPSQLECAIRGGALEEVMVSPNLEKVALRLKRPGVKPGSTLTGENVVTVEAKLLLSEELDNMVLLEGEGPDDLKWSGLEEEDIMTDVGGIVMQETVIGSESGESVALVPGQVVETSVGPRFVPGQIVVKESSEEEKGAEGEKVQFVPGEIVETSEGPRFVAPDLTETEDGKMAFSVQGFAVEDVTREKNVEEGGQASATQVPRRLSVQLEGIVQEVVSGGDGKKEPTGATIVKAIVSEKDILSPESVPEPMDVDIAQESNKKRRKDSEEEEEVGEGQAMIRHLSKKLQTKDSRESNESATENVQTPQVHVGEDLTKEEIELRVDEMRRLATEAASIGASLGLPPADAAALLEALSDPETAKALASDPVSVRLLRGGVKALRKQRRREMRRASRTTSGLLSLTEETGEDEDDDDDMDDESEMDIPDMIRSSRDIPSFLFKKLQDPSLGENDQEELANKILAGLRSNSDSPIPRPGSPESIAIVILKDNLQAVIPREASRRLLTGNAPFTIIDETGVRRFKPSPVGEGSIDKNALVGDPSQKPQTVIPQGIAETQPVSAAPGVNQGKTQSDVGVTQSASQSVTQSAPTDVTQSASQVAATTPAIGEQSVVAGSPTQVSSVDVAQASGTGVGSEMLRAVQEIGTATKGGTQVPGAGATQVPVSSAQISRSSETGGTQTGGTLTKQKEGLTTGGGVNVATPEDKRVPSEPANTTGSPGEVSAQGVGVGSTPVAREATKTTASSGGTGTQGATAGDEQVAGEATKTTASPGTLGMQVTGADAGKVVKSDQVSIGGTGPGHADEKEGVQIGITETVQVTSSTTQETGFPGTGVGGKVKQTDTGNEAGFERSGGENVGAKEGEKFADSIPQVTNSHGTEGLEISKTGSKQSSPAQVMVSSTGVSQVAGSQAVAQETVSSGKDGSNKLEIKSKKAEKDGSESLVKEIPSKKRSSSLSSKEFAVTSVDSELESAALKARWVARAAYTPGGDDQEGLALAEGDAVELVAEDETESAAKRARLQSTEVTESFFSSTTVVEGSSAVTSTSTSSSTRLLDNSAARHKISVRPRRKHADPRQRGAGVVTSTSVTSAEESDDKVLVRKVDEPSKQGWVPASILTAQDGTGLESGLSLSVVVAASQQEEFMEVDSEGNETAEEASFKRDAVIRELVETEEEFGKDLKFVVDRYLKPLEDHHGGGPITPSSSSASVASSGSSPTASIPRIVRDHKDVIFGNFSQISEFHNGVLIEGFKYYANEPKMIGRTFLRLERDFDKHVAYCRDEPQAQAFLEENEAVREYFEEYSQQIGDDKSLTEHLKLPIQRINDYQLLLKELVKYSNRLGEDATDLQRALELMLGVPHRSGDLKFISSIEGYRGNIHKLGRLLRHDWFSIEEGEAGGKTKERYLFLFKGKILVCKVRRIQDDRSVFALKEILRLPELELKDIPEDTKAFHLRRNPKVEAVRGEFDANFPLLIKAHSDEAKADWLTEIRQHAVEVFDVKEVPKKDLPSDVKKISEPEVQKKEDIKSPAQPTQKQTESPAAVPIQAPAESISAPSSEKKPETPVEAPSERKKTESPTEVKPTPKEPEVSAPPPKEPEVSAPPSKEPEVSAPPPKQPEVSASPPKQPEVSAPPPKQPESTAATPTAPKEPEGPTPSIPKQPESPAEVPVKPKEVETPLKASPAQKQPEGPTTTPSAPKEVDSSAKVLPETKKVETPIETPPAPKQPETPAVPEPSTDKQQAESVKVQNISSEAPSGTKRKEVELEDKDSTIKTEDHPTKKLATTETTASTNGNEEPGEMDSSYSMTRKSSRTSKVEVSSSYAESSQAEMYMETSSSTSARRSTSMRSSSVRFESDGIGIAENGALAIEAMSSSTNVARGSIGSDKKPTFTRTIEGFSCEPGEKAEFECHIRSDSITSLTWLKDNRPLDDRLADRISIKQRQDRHCLEIQHCRETDSGMYTALASNDYGVNSCSAHLVVQELTPEERKRRDEDKAPIFLVRLKDTELLENTYLRFLVKVKGDPNPIVRFYKNGKEIKEESPEERVHVVREQGQKKGYYELVIADVKHADAGKYSCVAVNEYGDATCEGHVTVTDEKTIFAGLGDETDSSAKPTFTWLRDGQPFDPEERFKVLFKDDEDSLALVFQHVKPEDAGLYTCVASTSSGKISCSAELTVKGAVNQLMKEPEKPKITTETQSTEVNVGGSAMLELKASGYPKPDVKWYKESGEEITAGGKYRFLYEDEESIALVMKGVTVDDGGKYKIIAKNDLGEDTAEIQLSVKSPPKILTKTTDMVCKVQETFEMTIEVEGSPAPDVKWYKDGQEVSASATVKIGSKKDKTSNSMSHSLTLTSTKLEDAGSYSVVATNELSQSSAFWKFTVTSPPRFVRSPAPETIIGEGEAVTIEARVEGYPAPTVKWLKDDNEIKADGKKIKINSEGIIHTLSLTGSGRYDAGVYTCVATNEHGTEKASGTLHVRCPPKFKQGLPKEAQANEGDVDVEFVVQVEAYPKPNIKWYLDEVEITEKKTEYTRIEEGDNYKLIIREVTTETSGKYSCKIFNDLGSSESSCSFSVLCKPRFPKGLSDKAVDEGDSLTLTIECYANPEPEVKWFKDGEEIKVDTRIHIKRDGSQTYNLILDIVKKSDTGEYEVRAKNNMGEVITRSKLHVHFAPEILSSNMTDSSLYESLSKVFEVKATGSPRPDAKWYKDGKELKASDKIIISDSGEVYKLEIKESLMSDEGVYKCVVSNRLGEKSVECKLSLICVNEFRKPKIACELKDVKVKKGEEAVLRATIIADPVPDITWYHDNKKLDPESDKVVAEMEEGPKEINDGLKECTFTLKVPNGEHFDSGVYRIKAKNKYGEGDCSARLDILLKPEIDGIKDVTTIPHENIIFKVIIYSNPVAKVVWTKDGEKVIATEKIKIIEDLEKEEYQIQLFDVGLAEDGVYTVTATNDQGESSSTATLKVHTEPPSFVKNLEDQTVKAYHDAEYRIRVNGIPKPQIRWYKDGVELKTGGRLLIEIDEEHQTSSLTLQHMEEDDEGKYTCRASNIVGDAETHSKLKMAQTPPSFARPLDRSAEVDEGDLLELKVKVDGSPIPSVKWYKDGEEIVPNEHIQLVALPDGNIKLTIESVKPTDCGAYKLVVANKNGEKSSICAVAVKPNPRRPSFTKGLEDTKLVVGQPLKLEVQVMAFPAPEIKWFKDGHPIRPSQAVNFVNSPGGIIGLHIDSVRPEDAGHYTITVANRLGEISGEADVQVEAREKKPQFQAFLQPVSVVEGYPAKMEIKVLGHPKPTLKWTHNGKEIVPDGQRVCIKELPDGTVALLIDKATAADAGEYAVIASNEKGDVTSKAVLDVAGKDRDAPEEPPSFVHALRDVSVDEGSPLVLEAPFLGNPIPEVKWTKDGHPLVAGERNMMTCDGRRVGLEVKPANLDDAGEYECTLTNPLGSATSSSKANVRKIYQKPSFTQGFGNTQQLPGFDAKFPVRVAGFPTPELTWYKNGEPINAAKHPDKYRIRRDGDTCCLFVRDCAPEDAGRYRCRASNLDGEASCEANLDVVEKIEKGPRAEAPSFLKRIGDCEVCQGMTAKFTACATGYPEPEFEWQRNGDRLWPSDRIKAEKEGSGLLRLSIFNVCPSDVGQYSLRIYNPHGEDKCEAQLSYDSLESRPKRPIGDQYVDYDKFRRTGLPLPLADRPIISRMTDRRLTLSWKPHINISPTDLRSPPVTYRLEMCEMPDGDWFTVRSGIRSCACDVSNLEPFRDYKFRVRVENKYGISDPSPFAITYREKLEPEPPKFFPYLEPGIDFRPETSPYFPKDFDIEKPPHDAYSQAPRFLRQEHDTQYGVKGHNSNLFWFVYGYPKPKMTYYFNDELIEMGGRYDASYTRNGQATLFINRMLDRDVGWYEAVARNEHGEARQRVRLEIAEFPKFITRPEEIVIMLRRSGRLEAKVTGVPYPEIKWYKDWQPLAPSSRVKMMFHPPDTCILSINDVINRDEGLYSISARNVAGSVSASAMIHVEEDEHQYAIRTYGRYGIGRPEIKARPGDGPKGFNELYDIGDELGRGTQGITYHAVERSSGHNYAAKIMHGKGDLRPFMYNELEILNLLNHRKILRLHEAYETNRNLTLILELASGGEFFDILSKQTYYTESDIAGYVRQILWGLEHLHENSIAHLGLTPGDILFSHPGGDEVKICDFGLARRIALGKLASLSYGVPEFVAPEVANGDGVGFPADMWSLGIIIHILLSGGISLFRGRNDKETLEKIKSLYENPGSYLSGLPDYLSPEARDFITQLLVVHTEKRMDVTAALRHPWLVRADRIVQDEYQIGTSGLRTYLSGLRDWYSNASCRKWFRRRPLDGAYTHPSKMVYPPGMSETPPDTPRVSVDRTPKEVHTWESMLPPREPVDYEIGMAKSESHYQYGPDTYLLQLRDVSFPVRLREYMKVAANRSPGYSRTIADTYDWRTPIIRERRRFTDVMDEEIDDERKTRIDRYGSREGLDGAVDGLPVNGVPQTSTITPRRLRRELGTRLDAHAEAEAYMECKREGQIPFFREKPQILPIRENHPAELVCLAVGDPKPVVQWFKNDMVITENNRIKISEDADGRSILCMDPALTYDVGIYKVVARNKIGQTVARTRLILASAPGSPDSPDATDVSDTEILLKWKQPHEDGNSPILCYSLQYKEADKVDWIDLGSNIDHEFYLVGGLRPTTSYHFRLAACNRIGWSAKGIPTDLVKTKAEGAPKVQMSRAMRHLQELTDSGAKVAIDDAKPHMDYSTEKTPPEWNDGCASDKFKFISEISRGRFSSVVKALEKSSDRVVAAKIFEWRQAPSANSVDGAMTNGVLKGSGAQISESGEAAVQREFEALRSLRHERVAFLESAWHGGGIAAFIMEKLQGADVLTFLSSRHEYSEEMVAIIITQVLDGLQYLHWRGYCHLNIQPDNIVMASVRSVNVKLVDFGSAQRVTRLGSPVYQVGHPEYAAPELQSDDPVAYPQTDIWSVGVIAYVLLSGESPFRGATLEETRQNVNFVRFRFEYLFKELTQEATRFIMLVFKKAPGKRPLPEECHEHRWLLPTEFMIKKRERAIFLGNRLKEFSERYHSERDALASKLSESLSSALGGGGRGSLLRSTSIQEELTATT